MTITKYEVYSNELTSSVLAPAIQTLSIIYAPYAAPSTTWSIPGDFI